MFVQTKIHYCKFSNFNKQLFGLSNRASIAKPLTRYPRVYLLLIGHINNSIIIIIILSIILSISLIIIRGIRTVGKN